MQFDELPYETVEHILNTLSYFEMHRLKVVSKDWNEILTYLISRFTWERFSDTNELDLVLDRSKHNPDPNYNWFLKPSKYLYEHLENEEYTSLPQLYGVSQIEYTFGSPTVIQHCEFYRQDDPAEIMKHKRKLWCDQVIINEIGQSHYMLIKQLTKLFLTERFDVYNKHYPVKLSFGENMIPLLLAKRTDDFLRIQFTSDGFMSHEDIRREHDFKLFKHKTKDENNRDKWSWEGLGDEWENMTVRKILETFNPVQKEQGQISFSVLALNHTTNTISHLFEAIIYVSECILDGHPIEWQ